MNANFYHIIDSALRQQPAQEVVIWPAGMGNEVSITAGDLLNQITATGNFLRQNGIKKGEKTLLLLPVGPKLISGLLAVMAIGALPVLPPAGISKTGLLQLVRNGNFAAALVATDPGFIASLALKLIGLKLINTSKINSTREEWLQPEPVDPEQAALISHSSGSTGKPKAIYRSHRVLKAQHEALKQAFPPFAGQVDFPLFPNILLHNLAVGIKSVLPDIPAFDLTKIEPARILEQLQQEKVNTLTGNVFYFRKLLAYLEQNPTTFPQVSALGIGGSPVPENLAGQLKQFFTKADIFIIYGSSEAEPIAVRKVNGAEKKPTVGYEVGPVLPLLEFKIDTTGNVKLATGETFETGEILVRGNHVAVKQNDWLRTGDFGFLNEQKQLVLTGRQGNETLHRGVQHYQVEHVLQQLPEVTRAAARSQADGFSIYVEGPVRQQQIREALLAHFPPEIIKEIKVQQHLPVDARHHSKIQYAKLT